MTDTAVGARVDHAARTTTTASTQSTNRCADGRSTKDRRAEDRPAGDGPATSRTAASRPASDQSAANRIEIPSGLAPAYGPPGWTIANEVWEVVGEFMPGGSTPWLDDDGQLLPLDSSLQVPHLCSRETPPYSTRQHVPVVETFQQLDAAAAAVLLDRLTPAQLRARTAGAPSVKRLLEVTAANPGDVFLGGIAARPGSAYEGITISSVCVLDPCAVHDAFGVPDSGCLGGRERDAVWAAVSAAFGLGDGPPPMVTDPVQSVPDGAKGWWLGWI